MIFVTVGLQLPFDRMIRAIDAWAGESGAEVFAQVGPSSYPAKHIRTQAWLTAHEFDAAFQSAELVVAHAGMGSILTALSFGKRLIIMPRRAALDEHRNDHQLATAKRFAAVAAVDIAWHEGELIERLRGRTAGGAAAAPISPYAPEPFLATLRKLIDP